MTASPSSSMRRIGGSRWRGVRGRGVAVEFVVVERSVAECAVSPSETGGRADGAEHAADFADPELDLEREQRPFAAADVAAGDRQQCEEFGECFFDDDRVPHVFAAPVLGSFVDFGDGVAQDLGRLPPASSTDRVSGWARRRSPRATRSPGSRGSRSVSSQNAAMSASVSSMPTRSLGLGVGSR